MIAEAAYYFAQKRGFDGGHTLDDWLAAEKQVRQVISPLPKSEAFMNETPSQGKPEASDPTRNDSSAKSRPGTPKHAASQFEKFAATQAAGDGVQGDVRKPDKTTDEKIGANMADRK
jgi:hypothetical protein